MRQNPHVRICGGPGSATTLVYPTASLGLVYASILVSSPGSRLASVIMSTSTFVRDEIMAAFQSGASAKLCFRVLVLKASEFRKSPFWYPMLIFCPRKLRSFDSFCFIPNAAVAKFEL